MTHYDCEIISESAWKEMATNLLVTEIMASLRVRFAFLNLHYEAAWTESWSHRRCFHGHQSLIDAAKCAIPTGAGWYVFAVESGTARELSIAEDMVVNEFRFRDVGESLKRIGAWK